jgi:transposase
MSQRALVEGMKDLRQEDRAARMAEVLRLNLVEGQSINAIHRGTGLDRKTIRNLLRLARGKQKARAATERSSILAPYEDEIAKALEECAHMKAPAVLDRLRAKGYRGGITVVRDRLRKVRPRPKQEAFFTRSYQPGQMLQVDWADFGFAIPGCARRVSAFVAALAYSRYLFLVFTLSQAMGSFLRCMEQALRFFGGRTVVDVFDNMKTVVLERTAHHVRFHPRFAEYAHAASRSGHVPPGGPRRSPTPSVRSAPSGPASGQAGAPPTSSTSTSKAPGGATTSSTTSSTRRPAKCRRWSSRTRSRSFSNRRSTPSSTPTTW